MSKKKELENKINILERQRFLDAYNEFDRWLNHMGYRPAKFFGEDTITDNNIMVNQIDCLYGIEHYILDALNMSLYFIRERNDCVFYFVWGFNYHSKSHSLEEFKAQILKDTIANKYRALAEIEKIPNT